MNVSLDGGQNNFRARCRRPFGHVGLEGGDSALHHARALDDLRQEHFARPEQLAYPAHGGHQRLFNHRERVFELAVKVHCHLLRPFLLAFEEYAQQPVVP